MQRAMIPELPSSRSVAVVDRGPVLAPAIRGAELVHLAEALYIRLARVGFAILLAGCGLTLLFATLMRGAPGFATAVFVAAAACFAVTGLARPVRVYLRLRSHRLLQVAPAAFGAVAVLLDGPDSPCYWIALALASITALVSSRLLAVSFAAVIGLAYLGGTLLGGQPLLSLHNSGVLPTAVGIPAYTLVAVVLIDGFAGLALGRRRRIGVAHQHKTHPLRVANLAGQATAEPSRSSPPPAKRTRSVSRLTARQLQVVLLLCDGLKQTEIAECLGISVRQVERHIGTARERVGALTTNGLVVMLVSGALESAPRDTL
jgi:DNA-binding CsgD family transcriptional regulator